MNIPKSLYNKRTLVLSLVGVLGLSFWLNANSIIKYITYIENDFIKALKNTQQEYMKQRQNESVYLSFDKPMYEAGDKIWFKAFIRDVQTLKPSAKSEVVYVEFIDPKGTVITKHKLIARDGKAIGDFSLSSEQVGGLYKVKAYTNWQKNFKHSLIFEKDIQVHKAVLPRLKMKLDFQKKAYDAGEEVKADFRLENLQNKPLKNHPFQIIASINGKEVIKQKGQTDQNGNCIIKFNLPSKSDLNDGLLNLVLQYQGQNESISRSIPLVDKNLSLTFFPEGGELIAGYPQKIAFKATDSKGFPNTASGTVYNSKNEKVASFRDFHDGMGAFKMTAKENEKYYAVLNMKGFADKKFALPAVQSFGYVMSVKQTDNKQIQVDISSTLKKEKEVSVVAKVRDKIYAATSVNIVDNKAQALFDANDFPIGVAQLTLFDSKGIARAERLAFVNQDKQLKIDIKTNKEKYQTREKVELNIKVTDERGAPMPGDFSLAVVNDQLLSHADDKSSHILSNLLLESSVAGKVHEPRFYFDKKEAKAKEALDNLLLTQGWRSFKWEKIQKKRIFIAKYNEEKTVITGFTKDKNEKAKSGVKVQIKGSDDIYYSNAKGKFTIPNHNLYAQATLVCTFPSGETMEAVVNNYEDPVYVSLRTLIIEKENMWEVGAVDDAVDDLEVMDAPVAVVPMNVNDKKPTKIKKNDKGNKKPKNDILIQKVEVENKKNKEEANNNRLDVQADSIAWLGEKDVFDVKNEVVKPKENTIYFYRAKVFPKVNYSENEKVEVRTDFRSTIFWEGNVITDKNGQANLSFYTNDAVTSFRAIVEGCDNTGGVGRAEKTFYTQLPFSMDIKVPEQVSMGDELRLPLTLVNNTSKDLSGVLEIQSPSAWIAQKNPNTRINIPANKAHTVYLDYKIDYKKEKGDFHIAFKNEEYQDAFVQTVNVIAKGFPQSQVFTSEKKEESFIINLNNTVKASTEGIFSAYPSTMSDVMEGLESMMREPHGCFEQTSSSTYPNIMVLRYIIENEISNPKIKARALRLIEKGYNRLISYESKSGGFEWFGGDPGHEALTAYGLMEFKDMAEVYDGVDPSMVDRTTHWLLSRRDGNGGYKRNPKGLDSFGRANKDVTNAYITWALSEARISGALDTEIAYTYESAKQTKDPYIMGLAANTLLNSQENDKANEILNLLSGMQKEDGSWNGLSHSVTRSRGNALSIESSALIVMAALKGNGHNISRQNIKRAADFIKSKRGGYGGFGNTQSTIMALKALTSYSEHNKRTNENGKVDLYVNGKLRHTAEYEAGSEEAIIMNFGEYLKEGKNTVKLVYDKDVKKPLPYALKVRYFTHQPDDKANKDLSFKTAMDKKHVKVGETVRMTAELKNLKNEGLGTSMIVLGIPSGLSPQAWQLKELQKKGAFDYYEFKNNKLALYYREMQPSEVQQIKLDLKAEIPGEYTGAASSAYLYYNNENKNWVAPQSIKVLNP